MRKILVVALFMICGCGMVGYHIEQKTEKYLDYGYTVTTLIWKDGSIVWSHYTWQESRETGRLYVPIDSIPALKKKDYQRAEQIVALMKESNFEK